MSASVNRVAEVGDLVVYHKPGSVPLLAKVIGRQMRAVRSSRRAPPRDEVRYHFGAKAEPRRAIVFGVRPTDGALALRFAHDNGMPGHAHGVMPLDATGFGWSWPEESA
jgi:hypothetical protein